MAHSNISLAEHTHRTASLANQGVAILYVITILAALLSIGVSVTNVLAGELRLSREIEYSFRANFAGDQGLERTFYRDRILREFPTPTTNQIEPDFSVNYPNGTQACFSVTINKDAVGTALLSRGFYQCGVSNQLKVQRTWQATY